MLLNSRKAISAPSAPPTSASASDSSMIETTTGKPPKPIARSVAISRARVADGRVHRVERRECRAERHDERDDAGEHADRLAELLGLPAVVLLLGLHVHIQARVGGQARP